MRDFLTSKKGLSFLLLLLFFILCLYGCLLLDDTAALHESFVPVINDFRAVSENQSIQLSWSSHFAPKSDMQLCLYIYSETATTRIELDTSASAYTFSNGTPGQLYYFAILFEKDAVQLCEPLYTSALFLSRDLLPDLPIIAIETANAVEPSCEIVTAPDGLWGQTIQNNSYVNATVTIYSQGNAISQNLSQIRVRGNTSAAGFKKPYKLKLTHPADLIGGRENQYASTDWLLLPEHNSLNLVTGLIVSDLCGLEWQPACKPVNVMLNGDWRGTYYLVESVEQGAGRVDISPSGFIIEADAYWWNEDGRFFRTPNQVPQIAYTFQYPSGKDVSRQLSRTIADLMTRYEDMLAAGNYDECFDCDSFVSWLLTHDLMGTWDAGGSNIFFYQNDLTPASKLKIGPAWDFDSAFLQTDEWARIHTSPLAYYDQLMQQPSFATAYAAKWESLSPELTESIAERMDAFIEEYGEALQDSWALDAIRYASTEYAVDDVVWDLYEWFDSRTLWMNDAIIELSADL